MVSSRIQRLPAALVLFRLVRCAPQILIECRSILLTETDLNREARSVEAEDSEVSMSRD